MHNKHRNILVLVSVLVASIMVLSSLSVLDGAGSPGAQAGSRNTQATPAVSPAAQQNQPAQQQPSGQPSPQAGSQNTFQKSVTSTLSNYKGPSDKIFVPNLKRSAGVKDGVVQPFYSRAPAPMGIGYLGTQSRDGHLHGSVLQTSSFLGSITLNNLSVANIANDGPDQVTIQLNTVMSGVTLFGVSNYSMWTQNVILYTLSTHQLSFEDNVWNFSSPAAFLTNNAIYSSTGVVYPYTGVHIAAGPTINMNFPFTVNLYMNATLINGRDAVFFNYSIPGTGLSGTYDGVVFNSTYGMPAGYSAPLSKFMVNGFQLSPVGLPYDAEIMLGGPGGGTGNSIYAVNGTMSLKYLQSQGHGKDYNHGMHGGFGDNGFSYGHWHHHMGKSQYVNVPSAYNFGTDTGETSEGMTVSWTPNSVAHLYAGPSLLYGMWNLSRTNQMFQFTGHISPSNAFMFVSQGQNFNESAAAWAPLSQSGGYNFYLPAGQYSAQVLMSYYDPQTVQLVPTFSGRTFDNHDGFGEHFDFHHFHHWFSQGNLVNLVRDPSMGIYTPLFAENNAQLANISTSGSGTQGNPYMLENQQYGPINPMFGELNDYNFPVFAGVMLYYTSASVMITGMPSLAISYLPVLYPQLNFDGLPLSNNLGYWLYHTSGVTIWNNSQITGWFYYQSAGIPDGNILTWDSSNTLIGNNTINTMDSGMVVFGGSNNTLFGNYFLTNYGDLNATELAAINIYGAPLGLSVYGSGNTIYNNYFDTYFTAYSPPQNPYNGLPVLWSNDWNVSLRPASSVSMVNGVSLSGSITGGPYEGGNYWWNFAGTVPYNDNLLMYPQGDYLPLNGLMKVQNPEGGISNNSGISAAPNPSVPDTTPTVVHLVSNLVVTSYGSPYTTTVNIPSGQWASIVLVYNGSATGLVYDSAYSLAINGVTMFTGTSPEYGNWSVQSNLTEYASVLHGSVVVSFSPPMAIISGSFTNSLELLLYPVTPGGQAPSEPNLVVPFSSSSSVTVPDNVTAANLQLYVYGFQADETWYANVPAYRDITVSVGSNQIASVLPFPYINTGGIDLFMWRPVTAVYTLNDVPYSVNVTGALGMLEGTNTMSMQVGYSLNSWTMNGNLMLYTSSSAGPATQLANIALPAAPETVSGSLPGGSTAFITNATGFYAYASMIPTATGYEIATDSGVSTFLNLQTFSGNSVWQNITQLELMAYNYSTVYYSNGQFRNVTTNSLDEFSLTMDLGTTFTTNDTNYPETGTLTQYALDLNQTWLHESTTVVTQGLAFDEYGSLTENSITGSGYFLSNATLTGPNSGVINSVDSATTQVTNTYMALSFDIFTGGSSYTHVIHAQISSAQPPYYQATITEDNIWVQNNIPISAIL